MLTTQFARVTCDGSFDALSGLAHLLHVRDVQYEQQCGAQQGTNHEADHGGVQFQIVTRGVCVIDLIELRRSVRLQFALEQPRENCVLAALPDVIVVRAAEHDDAVRMHRLISAIGDELDGGRAGGRAIANDLASALVMMIVRIHVNREHLAQGLLRMLGHRQAARAVEAMLNSPSRAWTLDELASQASASRASLVRMFQKTVRMAPLEFLAELRLGLARRKLSATDLPLAQIAAEIGYGSESSFSRAFQRRFGVRPAGLRTSGG